MAFPHESRRATVTLRLDLGAQTISGTLDHADRGERLFWGWVELSNGLDEVRGVTPTFRGVPDSTRGAAGAVPQPKED